MAEAQKKSRMFEIICIVVIGATILVIYHIMHPHPHQKIPLLEIVGKFEHVVVENAYRHVAINDLTDKEYLAKILSTHFAMRERRDITGIAVRGFDWLIMQGWEMNFSNGW